MTSTRRNLLLTAAATGLALAGPGAWWPPASAATPPKDPYTLEIWADMLFDTSGKLEKMEVPDAAQYPPAFVERVKKQLATSRIPPMKDDAGAPASFQTGMQVVFLITPGAVEAGAAATWHVQAIGVGARPVKRYAASRTSDMPADTPTVVRVRCEVGTDGRCTTVKVVAADGTSDVLRRWAMASMRGWVFEPQRVNGLPIASEAQVTLELEARDLAPRDFRDPRKLQDR